MRGVVDLLEPVWIDGLAAVALGLALGCAGQIWRGKPMGPLGWTLGPVLVVLVANAQSAVWLLGAPEAGPANLPETLPLQREALRQGLAAAVHGATVAAMVAVVGAWLGALGLLRRKHPDDSWNPIFAGGVGLAAALVCYGLMRWSWASTSPGLLFLGLAPVVGVALLRRHGDEDPVRAEHRLGVLACTWVAALFIAAACTAMSQAIALDIFAGASQQTLHALAQRGYNPGLGFDLVQASGLSVGLVAFTTVLLVAAAPSLPAAPTRVWASMGGVVALVLLGVFPLGLRLQQPAQLGDTLRRFGPVGADLQPVVVGSGSWAPLGSRAVDLRVDRHSVVLAGEWVCDHGGLDASSTLPAPCMDVLVARLDEASPQAGPLVVLADGMTPWGWMASIEDAAEERGRTTLPVGVDAEGLLLGVLPERSHAEDRPLHDVLEP